MIDYYCNNNQDDVYSGCKMQFTVDVYHYLTELYGRQMRFYYLCFAAMEISAGKMRQILRRMQSCIVVGVFCITK